MHCISTQSPCFPFNPCMCQEESQPLGIYRASWGLQRKAESEAAGTPTHVSTVLSGVLARSVHPVPGQAPGLWASVPSSVVGDV